MMCELLIFFRSKGQPLRPVQLIVGQRQLRDPDQWHLQVPHQRVQKHRQTGSYAIILFGPDTLMLLNDLKLG
jgi:hypothetical protein